MLIIQPAALVRQLEGQTSFHMASEDGLRIEFILSKQGQKLGPLQCEGEVLVLIVQGEYKLPSHSDALVEGAEVLFVRGEPIELTCVTERGALQIVWAPPFSQTVNAHPERDPE